MRLVLDIGNTRAKWGLFDEDTLYQSGAFTSENLVEPLESLLNDYAPLQAIGYSTVKKTSSSLDSLLNKSAAFVMPFSIQVNSPIRHSYKTPETLGTDRWANAIAAASLYPNQNVMIVDIGTCLKCDILTSDGIFIGGSIAPGMKQRYKAMHDFTDKLPLLEPKLWKGIVGTTTNESMHSGVIEGMLLEIEGRIRAMSEQFTPFICVLTGGDAKYFDSQLKNSTFAHPNLTLRGIHTALRYNEE